MAADTLQHRRDALGKARPHAADNIFQDDLSRYAADYESQPGRLRIATRPTTNRNPADYEGQPGGAKLLLKRVSIDDARRFGVATVEGDRITKIVEKPAEPESSYVVTGCHMYDARVFDIIDGLVPSARGELEITDVNNAYASFGDLSNDVLPG